METVMRFLEKSFAILNTIITPRNEGLLVVAACVVFVSGCVVLYTKGLRPGVPLSLAGILMILLAILAKLRIYLF